MKAKGLLSILCAFLILAAVFGGITVLAEAPAETPEEPEALPEEYFAESVPNEAGKAYIDLVGETWTVESGDTSYRMYTFTLTEINGIAFSIEHINVYNYNGTSPAQVQSFTKEALEATGFSTELSAGGTAPLTGGFPLEAFDRVGIVVEGQDANGKALSFRAYMDFRE